MMKTSLKPNTISTIFSCAVIALCGYSTVYWLTALPASSPDTSLSPKHLVTPQQQRHIFDSEPQSATTKRTDQQLLGTFVGDNNTSFALISIDNQKPQRVRVGSTLEDGRVLTHINKNSIDLSSPTSNNSTETLSIAERPVKQSAQ